ncbi:MAG: CotH kinase family protein [Clostridia bacterium]|nr:CotH kinase family protein [Clostridia bacterium]
MYRFRFALAILLLLSMLLGLCACGDDQTTTTKQPPASSSSSTSGATSSSTSTALPVGPTALAGLVINEVCSKNETLYPDGFGEYYDWIELYNGTDRAMPLAGVTLSDDANEPSKFTFPAYAKIEPHSYVIVFACGNGNVSGGSDEFYASFRLASAADSLYLFASDGTLVDGMEIPALGDNASYGRKTDGNLITAYLNATPGYQNGGMTKLSLANVTLSHQSGFYTENFTLTAEIPSGYKLYYTTDSTIPTKSSAVLGDGLKIKDISSSPDVISQIVVTAQEAGMWYPDEPVDKGTVFRYRLCDEAGNLSDCGTATYFVDFEEKDGYDGISVVSLVTSPDNLFDSQKGIFVNGNWEDRGAEAERPVSLTYYDQNGNFVFTQDCGMRIRGSSTRAYQQKSLSIYARDEYGADEFIHPMFDGVEYLKSFILRYDGSLKFHEGYLSALVADREIATAKSIPCVVFLDGEYYGMYTILEKFTKQYVEEHYGIDKDNVAIVKKGALEEGISSDLTAYNNFINYVTGNDMSRAANYQKACSYMDMQSFIDYVCFQIYCGNEDWSLKQNFAAFRARDIDPANPYADGKWRFMLYDLDFCIGIWNRYDHIFSYDTDTFTAKMPFAGNGPLSNPLFASLIENDDFCEQFVLTFLDMANTNFAPENAIPLLYETANIYAEGIENYYRRFGDGVATKADYLACIDNFAVYFERRFEYIVSYMEEHFDLSGKRGTLVLNAENSSVQLNTLTLENQTLEAVYTVDYALCATALEKEGYTFSHWQYSNLTLSSGSVATSKTISFTLSVSQTASLTAVYTPIS